MAGGLHRRDALRLMGAGGVAAVAGCTFPARPRPIRGGRIRVATPAASTADTLDPARQAVVTDYCRCNMFYNGLTKLDDHSRAELVLAQAIDSTDARTWTIRLRPGVLFHDGKPLTAADVIYSIRRHKDPAVGSKAAAFAGQFADVTALGTDAVRITLSGPNADLPVILGLPHFQIVRAGTTRFATANGTGPFRCAEFQPGVRSVAIRNEDYWRGPVPLGEVELFSIADDSARLNALLSGDVDLINSVNPRITSQIRRTGFGVLETKTGGYTDLVMRLDRAPGNAADFVRGMKLLMDRETMRTAVFRGYATTANDQPIPPTNPYWAADLPQRAFDPEKAGFHFRKAGLAGATIPLVASTAAEKSDDLGVLMQDAARRAGITLNLRRVPADGYWTNSWMKVPVGFGNVNPRPTADIIFTQFFSSAGPWNESGWHDARFDRLLLEARASTDESLRKAIYGEMQHRIHDDAGIGIPLFLSLLDAHSPRLKGLKPMPSGGLMGYDFAAHVWLDEKA